MRGLNAARYACASLTAALALGACGGDDETPAGDCEVAGTTQACSCLSGGTGIQLCGDDLFWSACDQCEVPDVPDAAADTVADAPIEGCVSDEECGAYQCVGLSIDLPGDCGTTCRVNQECNEGYECVASECVEAAPDGCESDDDCTGYLCDTASGLCFTACTDGSECAPGYTCDAASSACSPPPTAPLTLVAVLSEAAEEDASVKESTKPGADIDAVELFTGASFFQGAASGGVAGAAPVNDLTDPSVCVGAADAVPGDGADCNLDAGYFSLGAAGGFVLIQFPDDVSGIGDNAEIRVYEVNAEDCPNLDSDFDDPYSVWIGEATDPPPANAAQIRATWCQIGNAPTGGTQDFVVDLDLCD